MATAVPGGGATNRALNPQQCMPLPQQNEAFTTAKCQPAVNFIGFDW